LTPGAVQRISRPFAASVRREGVGETQALIRPTGNGGGGKSGPRAFRGGSWEARPNHLHRDGPFFWTSKARFLPNWYIFGLLANLDRVWSNPEIKTILDARGRSANVRVANLC
jgi:hypothetical protein